MSSVSRMFLVYSMSSVSLDIDTRVLCLLFLVYCVNTWTPYILADPSNIPTDPATPTVAFPVTSSPATAEDNGQKGGRERGGAWRGKVGQWLVTARVLALAPALLHVLAG